MAIYAPINGFLGYRVGDDGSVWTAIHLRRRIGYRVGFEPYLDEERWRLLAQTPDKDGYLIAKMQRDGKQYTRKVAKLVLEAFVGPCPRGFQACHNDGIKQNNAVTNLRWDTRKGNEADKIRHGTLAAGERSGNARLTRLKVIAIHQRRADGATLQVIAEEFGITFQHAGAILDGKRWRAVYAEVAKVRGTY